MPSNLWGSVGSRRSSSWQSTGWKKYTSWLSVSNVSELSSRTSFDIGVSSWGKSGNFPPSLLFLFDDFGVVVVCTFTASYYVGSRMYFRHWDPYIDEQLGGRSFSARWPRLSSCRSRLSHWMPSASALWDNVSRHKHVCMRDEVQLVSSALKARLKP